jgi:hypothetical protein
MNLSLICDSQGECAQICPDYAIGSAKEAETDVDGPVFVCTVP